MRLATRRGDISPRLENYNWAMRPYGEISSMGVLLLTTPCNVTVNGKFPGGNPSGNLTMM